MSPKNRNESQFDQYRDWQWCKHQLLRDYVTPWSEIVGKGQPVIYAIDTCAGRASYDDPVTGEQVVEGSPVIFGRRAAAYNAKHGPGRLMKVFCCEANPNNYAGLVENVAPFAAHVRTLPGDFAKHVDAIVREIRDAPALVFLDPIGLKAIEADVWRPLLDRRGKTDLFIVLHLAVVHRIGGMLLADGTPDPDVKTSTENAAMLDRVFCSDAWRAIALDPKLRGEENREERERRYVNLYFDKVIGPRHKWKVPFEVRARLTAPVKYWLVHASDDWKPYMLVNDEIVKLNEMLFVREHPQAGQLDGFVDLELEAQRQQLRAQIESAAIGFLESAPNQQMRWGELHDLLLPSFYGKVKQGAYWSVVKELIKGDVLSRERRKAAAADENEMITFGPPATKATDATDAPLPTPPAAAQQSEPIAAGTAVTEGTYSCAHCDFKLTFASAGTLPPCPSCGNAYYDAVTAEIIPFRRSA